MRRLRLRDARLSDIDRLMARTPVPDRVWREAGLAPDRTVRAIADCTADQLAAFALMSVNDSDAACFRARVRRLLEQLYEEAGADTGTLRARWAGLNVRASDSEPYRRLFERPGRQKQPELVIGSRKAPRKVIR